MKQRHHNKSNDDFSSKAKYAAIINTIDAVLSYSSNKRLSRKIYRITEITEALEVPLILNFLEIFDIYGNFSNLKTIDDIIRFLGNREPIFKVLLFNFTDNELILPSIILFYTTFFDIYFLKQSKKEMLERVKTILFTNINAEDTLYELYQEIEPIIDENEIENKILTNSNTYFALIYFIYKGKIHFQKDKVDKDDYSFETRPITQIVNDYLFADTTNLSPMYYQLQFLFNEMDKEGQSCHISENILNVLNKFRKIKVPKYQTLAANIISRNIALIQQDKIYKEMQKNKKEKEIDHLVEAEEEENEIELPKTFQRRCDNSQQMDLMASLNEKKTPKNIPPEEFWNPPNKKYEVDDCILFKPQNVEKNFDYFDKAINYYIHPNSIRVNKYNILINEGIIEFNEYKSRNVKTALNRLFYYNESEFKWEHDSAFAESVSNLQLQLHSEKTVLVLFSNSFEKDLIQLNTNLIKSLYPDLDSNEKDEIFVYALCGPQLLLLNYYIRIAKFKEDDKSQEEQMKKPIFILLHIPESKRKLKNLNIIIYQIYFFLSLICDIEIVVLNRSHYRDQINSVKNMNMIKHLYNESSIQKAKLLTDSSENFFSNIKKDNDSDYDYEYDVENIDHDKDDDKANENDDEFSKVDPEFYQKPGKFIMLINSDKIHDNNDREPGKFVQFIEKEVSLSEDEQVIKNTCHVHYINTNDSVTYRHFLESLNEFAISCNSTTYDVFYRLSRINITQIKSIYINLKNEEKLWKKELNNIIRSRFNMIKQSDTEKRSDFDIIAELNNEVVQIYPSIDYEFGNECNSIMADITNQRALKNKEVFAAELKESSQNSILYWTKIIQKQDCWTEDQKENIIDNHINFLKNEFFSIITFFCSKKDSFRIFEANYDTLENQIIKDKLNLGALFIHLEQKFNTKKQEKQKYVDIAEQRKKGTNYMIRERENVREIKATVEVGQLDVDIDRDF